MHHSEMIDKIAGAFSKAQSAFTALIKEKTAFIKSDKGSYSYDYADLASVLESARAALAANGLSVSQPVSMEGADLTIETWLLHESGQYFMTTFTMRIQGGLKEAGIAITYIRRYCLTALLGIASEDDQDTGEGKGTDRKSGNAPTGTTETPAAPSPSQPPTPAPTPPPAPNKADKKATADKKPPTLNSVGAYLAKVKTEGITLPVDEWRRINGIVAQFAEAVSLTDAIKSHRVGKLPGTLEEIRQHTYDLLDATQTEVTARALERPSSGEPA